MSYPYTCEEITFKLANSTVFSKMDAKHGYWSVVLDNDSSKLTTFNSPFGRFCFRRLPFGLCLSQDVFQTKMNQILELCPGTIGISDDICVFGKTTQEHDQNLKRHMEVARKKGLVFNSEKCEIKTPTIKFFGQIYDKEGAHPDPEKVAAIKEIEVPKTVKQLQKFMGIVTYMAPYIPQLSKNTASLRELLKKDAVFEWTDIHTRDFQRIKDLINEQVTLAYFDPNKESVIEVDASLKGVGCVLTQDGKPIYFASKAFTETEQRYANIEREMLAVVYACERFHNYIYGNHFIVESDHKPLEMIKLKNLSAAPPRLQRLLLRLQSYDMTIRYKPGKDMVMADALSRLNPLKGEPIEKEEVVVNFVQFSEQKVKDIKRETMSDPELSSLMEIIIDGWPEKRRSVPKPIQKYWAFRDELSIENGIIIKGDRLVIPQSMQSEILDKIHVGHQGIIKSQLRAKTCVFWNNINKDIESMVKKCIICQEHGSSLPPEPLEQFEIPTRPWQVLGSDLFYLNGVEHLLVTDYYSKFFLVKEIPKGQSSSNTIIEMLKQMFSEHGIPEKMVTDNGSQYVSYAFKRFSEEWSFCHVTSSPRYPKSNGFIERQVQIVKNCIRKAKQSKTDVSMALLALRATPVDAKLPSPAELLTSRKYKANLPVKIGNRSHNKYEVGQRLQDRQIKQKYYHDRNTKGLSSLSPGQNVFVQSQDTGKWSPGKIVSQRSEPRSYDIETPTGGILRRNRRHIKVGERSVSFEDQQYQDGDDSSDTDSIESTTQGQVSEGDEYYHTRAGRRVIPRKVLDL